MSVTFVLLFAREGQVFFRDEDMVLCWLIIETNESLEARIRLSLDVEKMTGKIKEY